MPRRRTRPGRLSALDHLLIAHDRALLARRDGPFGDAPVVDVGLGDTAVTTLELVDRLIACLADPPPVLGLDVDERLVARAQAHARPGLAFAVADLAKPGTRARLVRAMNLLRDWPPERVPHAHAALGAMLLPGGVLLEGSADPDGQVGTALRLRRIDDRLVREALWMWTADRRGSAPQQFRDRLPRDLRRVVHPGHPLGRLMAEWMQAYVDVRSSVPRGLERLEASVLRLDRPDLTMLAPGAVAWTPRQGVPAR